MLTATYYAPLFIKSELIPMHIKHNAFDLKCGVCSEKKIQDRLLINTNSTCNFDITYQDFAHLFKTDLYLLLFN